MALLPRPSADVNTAPKESQTGGALVPDNPLSLNFLDDCGVSRGANGRGEIAFYNLGKFTQVITDFETIHGKIANWPITKSQANANFTSAFKSGPVASAATPSSSTELPRRFTQNVG